MTEYAQQQRARIDVPEAVLEAELEEINKRKLLSVDGQFDVRSQSTLPNFERYLVAKDERSPALNNVIDAINDEAQQVAWEDDHRIAHPGLVGLCFSGGGIRSATTNLGVIQALKKSGVMTCVDYMSTVSGGGYIGSCYSSVSSSIAEQVSDNDEATQRHAFENVFRHRQGQIEAAEFRHLRNNANYMAPSGLIDVLRVPAVFIRGMMFNGLTVLPIVIVAALLSAVMFHYVNVEKATFWPAILGHEFVLSKIMLGGLVGLFLFSAFVDRRHQGSQSDKGGWERRNRMTKLIGGYILALLAMVIIEFQPIALGAFVYLNTSSINSLSVSFAALSSATSLSIVFTVSMFIAKVLQTLSSRYSQFSIVLLALASFALFWTGYLALTSHVIDAFQTEGGWREVGKFALVAALLGAAMAWLANANFTSINRFYRDRLSKAYLFKRIMSTGEVTANDTQKLSELDSEFSPYHLLNATLNVSKLSNAYKRDRHGEFFVMSKRHIGSQVTGYAPTKTMEAWSDDINLGTAMATSGAAVAPNMGRATNKTLVFLLAMLNVRYDYWCPNPKVANRKHTTDENRPSHRRVPGPRYFLRELTSNLSTETDYVNLSDGGHLENMGAYELIRRQCRLIIMCDAEADPDATYGGLADLIRMVQTDMGIWIEMEGLDAIANKQSRVATGTIHYSDKRKGKILYMKSGLAYTTEKQGTAEETVASFDRNPYVANYQADNPMFPNQSSSNQFFTEAQFEAYRALGYDLGQEALLNSTITQNKKANASHNPMSVNV